MLKGAALQNLIVWVLLSLGLIALATAVAPISPGSGPFWLRAQLGTPLLWFVDALVPLLLGYGLAARARTMTQAERIIQLRDEYRKQVEVLLARAESLDARNRVYQEHLNSYGDEDETANAETGRLPVGGRETLASGPLLESLQQQLQAQQKMLKGIHLMLQIQHAELTRLSAGLRVAPILEGNERGTKGNKGEEKIGEDTPNAEAFPPASSSLPDASNAEETLFSSTENWVQRAENLNGSPSVSSPGYTEANVGRLSVASIPPRSPRGARPATAASSDPPVSSVVGDTLRFEVAVSEEVTAASANSPVLSETGEPATDAQPESQTPAFGSTRIAPRRRRRETESR